ncbi:MAG TPA: lysylphosphatidylglycerol synthase transmembrane domain-containing protein [Myxococcota bacterium]|nr:lysylphosphatidylglycerol synthase transmembrane domain-containing protein [Myxococcota bacterium]
MAASTPKAASPGRKRRSAWRNPIVWVGVAVTALSVWYTLRGVPLGEVALHVRRANWLVLLAGAVPSNLLGLYLRALRWRHLTDPIRPIATGPLFRATSIGFMANNIYPARAGEFLRAWYLSRETGADAAAILATVILERVIDSATFLPILAGVAAIVGTSSPALRKAFAVGVPILIVAALLPFLLVLALRLAPNFVIRLWRVVCERLAAALQLAPDFVNRLWQVVSGRLLPGRVAARGEELLRRFADGLGSLSGGTHLLWIAVHSFLIWMVVSIVPFYVGLYAVGIDLGSTTRNLEASYAMLAFVGLAVALPSVPGFFGLYHGACTMALAIFGVPKDQAVALGTVVHLTFWASVNLVGLLALRSGHTSLHVLEEAAAESREPDPEPAGPFQG